MRSIRGLAVVSVALVMFGAVACSSDETSEPTGGGETSEPAADAGTLTISGSTFTPGDVVTASGGALTVVNDDGIGHTFTMDDGSVDESLAGGATVDVTIAEGGAFHCEIHPSMTGTVTVG